VTNPLRYQEPEWLEVHHDLERYALDKHCFQHRSGQVYRKGWEWTHCIYGLRKLGMIQPQHTALGVGAGRECLIFYLADHIRHVVASDLYGQETWSADGGREAAVDLLEEALRVCPPTVDRSKITLDRQDGTQLTYDEGRFDFCWSLSSIEHFGGHQAAAAAVREMARVTRPGGIVALATELLLFDDYSHPEYFTRPQLREHVIAASDQLELVEEVDFDALPTPYLIDSVTVPDGVHRYRRHVVLNDGHVQWTSVLLFFRRRG
jgi:SAM-dependent methyltransferase